MLGRVQCELDVPSSLVSMLAHEPAAPVATRASNGYPYFPCKVLS